MDLIKIENNKIVCTRCAKTYQLKLTGPLIYSCSNCEQTFYVYGTGNIRELDIKARKFQEFSIIQIGTTGIYNELAFEVIGRLKRVTSNSVYNEWLIYFSDANYKWLIECGSKYFIYDTAVSDIGISSVKGKIIGDKIEFKQKKYNLVEIARHVQSYFEGELPEGQSLTPHKEYFINEFRNTGIDVATVFIYTKTEIKILYGTHVDLQALKLSTMKQYDRWQ